MNDQAEITRTTKHSLRAAFPECRFFVTHGGAEIKWTRLSGADDAPLARLWATFATPKKPGSIAREQYSEHELPGIWCRGFQLFAGGERGNVSDMLFETQRGIGPDCYGRIVGCIRNFADKPVPWLVMLTGMPTNFVIEIINEAVVELETLL